jgi:hypothetical protein
MRNLWIRDANFDDDERTMSNPHVSRPLCFLALFAPIALVAACSNDSGPDSSSGAAGSGGTAGQAASGGGSGSGVETGGAGQGGGDGGICHGNETIWDAIKKQPVGTTDIACTKNSDCCLVENFCTCTLTIVGTADVQTTKDNWPYCTCGQDCIYQSVKIECAGGTCKGTSGSGPGFSTGTFCGK